MIINKIVWREDKSGDIVTSSRKVGALRLWNVAQDQPKQVIKIGSHGVHALKPIKGDPKRVLVAFINGAVQVFNLAKKKVEFNTEAGHAETVFDLEFCPINKDIIASCSYDGTVRVWDVNSMKLLQINDTLKNTPI
jgi:WD40 repeat protein